MPVDPLEYSYKVVKPFAYESTTSPIGQKAHTNSTSQITSTLNGAASGSAFGPWGAGIGAAVGLISDLWQARYAKKRAKEANEEARRAAAESSARLSSEARAARNYNSEQAQIRRIRMAGLSPGVAYGQMSPSTAQPASQDKADVYKADTPKFDNESILHALQLLINLQNANTQAAAQQSTSALQGSQIDLNLIDKLYKGAEYQANIASILSNNKLTDAKKIETLKLLAGRQTLLESQANASDAAARQSNAAANVTERTGVDLAKSQTAANNASAALNAQQEKVIKLTYDLDNAQWNSIQKFMKDNGYDQSLAPLVMKAINSIAEQSGATVRTIIDNLSKFPDIIKSFLSGM